MELSPLEPPHSLFNLPGQRGIVIAAQGEWCAKFDGDPPPAGHPGVPVQHAIGSHQSNWDDGDAQPRRDHPDPRPEHRDLTLLGALTFGKISTENPAPSISPV